MPDDQLDEIDVEESRTYLEKLDEHLEALDLAELENRASGIREKESGLKHLRRATAALAVQTALRCLHRYEEGKASRKDELYLHATLLDLREQFPPQDLDPEWALFMAEHPELDSAIYGEGEHAWVSWGGRVPDSIHYCGDGATVSWSQLVVAAKRAELDAGGPATAREIGQALWGRDYTGQMSGNLGSIITCKTRGAELFTVHRGTPNRYSLKREA